MLFVSRDRGRNRERERDTQSVQLINVLLEEREEKMEAERESGNERTMGRGRQEHQRK